MEKEAQKAKSQMQKIRVDTNIHDLNKLNYKKCVKYTVTAR